MNKRGMDKMQRAKTIVRVGKKVLARITETARLMVGVGDYPRYLQHMALHHADVTAMSETEYFRYCQNSRYPGKDGSVKRCPC